MVQKVLNDYLNPSGLAAELGVTVRTLQRWDSLGYGPPKTKVGHTVLYDTGGVRQWLKQHERQPVREFPT